MKVGGVALGAERRLTPPSTRPCAPLESAFGVSAALSPLSGSELRLAVARTMGREPRCCSAGKGHSCGEGSSRARGTARLTSSRDQEKHRPLPFIRESRPCRDLLVRWTPFFHMRKRETQPQQQI